MPVVDLSAEFGLGLAFEPSFGGPVDLSASFELGLALKQPRAALLIPLNAALDLGLKFSPAPGESRRITELVQSHSVGQRVTLFIIDATNLGGPIYYITPAAFRVEDGVMQVERSERVRFGGIAYEPWPVNAEGFEWSGQGAQATPTLTVAAVIPTFISACIAYDNFVGATVTRIRTFSRYLDDGVEPDPNAVLPLDIYRIERLSRMQPAAFIEWELAPATDQEGVLLPRRQVLSQYCTHTYRRWNGTAFVYGSCPYTGSQFFTEQGTSTNDPAKDKCSRRLDTGCIKRFGNNPLPTRAFPGVLQNRG